MLIKSLGISRPLTLSRYLGPTHCFNLVFCNSDTPFSKTIKTSMEEPRVVPKSEICAGEKEDEKETFESADGEVFVDLIESLFVALIDKLTSTN